MASAAIAGLIEVEFQSPTGNIYPLIQGANSELGPSGAPDHVPASTPEKWVYVPMDQKTIPANSQIRVFMTVDSAATQDESDNFVSLPFRDLSNKVVKIRDSDMTAVLGDAAYVAGAKTLIYTYNTRQPLRFGGGLIFVSVENNA